MPVPTIERYDAFVQKLKDADLYDDNYSFVKGGFWRNFLSKYAETNHLHKRMLYVSKLLDNSQLEDKGRQGSAATPLRGTMQLPLLARSLWRSISAALTRGRLSGVD